MACTSTTGNGTFSIDITPIGGSTTTVTGTFINSGAPERARFFNFNAGSGGASNCYFNSLILGTAAPTATTPQTLCVGSAVSNLTATGTGIQWYANNSGGSPLPGSTPLVNGTTYHASQTINGCESNTRTPVIVNLPSASVGGTASSNQSVCSGAQPANITLSGHSGSIQWQRSSDAGFSSPTNIGTNSTTLTGAEVGTITSVTYVRAVVTNSTCSPANSNTVTLSVASSVGGTATATNAAICPGGSTTITLTGNTGTIQWQRSTNSGSTWNNISGATGASYATEPLVISTSYRAVVTNGSCASANSSVATVSITSGAINTAEAGNAAYNSGWTNGSDDGTTGFGAWILTPSSNNDNAGFFTGSSNLNDAGSSGLPNINTGGRSWGMYSNSSNTASAVRNITGNMTIGQIISFSMDIGSVKNFSPFGTVGMGLQNSVGNNLMELYFVGGNAQFTFNDGTGTNQTTIPFTRGGIEVSITLTSATTYTIRIVRKENGETQTVTRTFLSPSGGQIPSRIRFFSFNAGNAICCGGLNEDYNFFINSLSITNPVITTQPSTGTQTLNLGVDGTPISVTASGSGLSYQWYRNTSPTNSGGTEVGTNSISHTPNETTAGTYYYYVTVTGACGSATSNPSGAITVNNTNVWVGDNGNWNVGSNWSSGNVPTGDQVIEINSGTPSLNVPFVITSGSLSLNNPAALVITPGGRLGKTGGNINLNNRPVTVRSNENGSGAIGQMQGSPIAGSTNITIERYIPGKRAWRGIAASGLKGTTNNSIYQNWQNNGTVLTNPNFGVEIFGNSSITGTPESNASGLARGVNSSTSSMLTFNSSANQYDKVTSTKGTALFNGDGPLPYFLFVTGPFENGSGNISISQGAEETTLRATGELFTGTRTWSGLAANQFHLIPNPYASPVDFTLFGRNNIQNKFWIWDPKRAGTGAYYLWDNGVMVPTPGQGSYTSISTIIESGQSFFIRTEGSAGTLTMEESDKSNTDEISRFSDPEPPVHSGKMSINLLNTGGELLDGVVALYAEGASTGVGNDDARKPTNVHENMSLLRTGTNLMLERRPVPQGADTFHLRLYQTQQSNYVLSLNLSLEAGFSATLSDKWTNQLTPLPASGTFSYPFTVSSNAATTGQRFDIIIQGGSVLPLRMVQFSGVSTTQGNQLTWETAEEKDMEGFTVERSSDGNIFKPVMKVAATNQASASYGWLDAKPLPGDNFYRLQMLDKDGKTSFSRVIRIRAFDMVNNGRFTVYPNILTGGNRQITISGLNPGEYTLQLLDNNGRNLLNRPLSNSLSTGAQSMLIPENLPSGVYLLQVKEKNGESRTTRLMIQ